VLVWLQRALWAVFVLGALPWAARSSLATGWRTVGQALLLFLPVAITLPSAILSETLFAILLWPAAWLAVKGVVEVRLWQVALSGILLGMATLVRPSGLHVPLMVVAGLIAARLVTVRMSVSHRALLSSSAVLLLFGYLLPVAWMYRNFQAADYFRLTSLTGSGMALHRSAAIARLPLHQVQEFQEPERLLVEEVKKHGDTFWAAVQVRRQHGLNAFEAEDVLRRVGWTAIRAEPLNYIQTSARNLWAIFNSPAEGMALLGVVTGNEKLRDLSLVQAFNEKAYFAAVAHLLLRCGTLLLVVVLPSFLIARGWREYRSDPFFLVGVPVAIYLVAVPAALTITYDRFLFPILPLIGYVYCRAAHLKDVEKNRG